VKFLLRNQTAKELSMKLGQSFTWWSELTQVFFFASAAFLIKVYMLNKLPDGIFSSSKSLHYFSADRMKTWSENFFSLDVRLRFEHCCNL
jgi:hypothetical protein